MRLLAVQKSRKRSGFHIFICIHIVKTVHLQQLKGMQSSKSTYVTGPPFFNIRYTKGVPFLCQQWYRYIKG